MTIREWIDKLMELAQVGEDEYQLDIPLHVYVDEDIGPRAWEADEFDFDFDEDGASVRIR